MLRAPLCTLRAEPRRGSSAPIAENRVERVHGECKRTGRELHHHELLYMIGGYSPEQGAAVAGHRGYFLRDVGVLLNQALINYGLAFLRSKG